MSEDKKYIRVIRAVTLISYVSTDYYEMYEGMTPEEACKYEKELPDAEQIQAVVEGIKFSDGGVAVKTSAVVVDEDTYILHKKLQRMAAKAAEDGGEGSDN